MPRSSLCLSLPNLLLALACLTQPACTDDADDGKASDLTLVELTEDGGLDQAERLLEEDGGAASASARTLDLICRKAVVSENMLGGFSVSLRDADGPVANAFVAISPSTGNLVSEQPGGGVTDARGIVEFGFAAPHFDSPTTITLDASTRDNKGKTVASARCSFALVTSGLEFSMPEDSTVVPFGRVQMVTLKVVAQDVVPSCALGGGVSFGAVGASRANFSASETDPPRATACLDVPADGNLRLWARGTDAGGTARIEARTTGYRAELALQMVGAPAGITMSSDSTDLSLSSAANLKLKVVDDVGQGVAGVKVRVSIARCADVACMAGESIAPAEVVTSNDGTAASAYFSGSVAGAAQLQAVVMDRPKVSTMTVLRVK